MKTVFMFMQPELGGFFEVIDAGMEGIAVVVFLVAALQCFLGYKLFKFWVAVCGFFTFWALGGLAIFSVLQDMGAAVVFGILPAILGAFISFKLYKVGVFILCGFLGFLFAYILAQSVELGIVAALVLGVLSVFLVKPVIIVSTSISSGLLAGVALSVVLDVRDPLSGIILGVLFAIFGLLVQFATNKETKTITQSVSPDNIPEPLTSIQEETRNNLKSTQAEISDSIKYFSKKSIEKAIAIKDSSAKTGGDFWIKIKNRIDKDNSDVMAKAKGLLMDEVWDDLEEIFYSYKPLKYTMPFIEYILYLVGFIAVIAPFLLFTQARWVSINITILLVVGILCFSKKKYNAIAISFSLVFISRSIMIINWLTLPYSKNNLFVSLIDTLIVGYIAFVAIEYFLKSENGIRFKNILSELFSKQKGSIKNRVPRLVNKDGSIVSCPNCGESNKPVDKFCGNCGQRLFERDKTSEL